MYVMFYEYLKFKACPCPPRMKELGELEQQGRSGQSSDKCISCSADEAVYDGKHCLKCGTLNPYNGTNGLCNPCPPGHIEGLTE